MAILPYSLLPILDEVLKMPESTLKIAMDKRGQPLSSALKIDGVCYSTFRRHYKGLRSISAKDAIKYEKLLGIPRYELRPDLWAEPVSKETLLMEALTALLKSSTPSVTT